MTSRNHHSAEMSSSQSVRSETTSVMMLAKSIVQGEASDSASARPVGRGRPAQPIGAGPLALDDGGVGPAGRDAVADPVDATRRPSRRSR